MCAVKKPSPVLTMQSQGHSPAPQTAPKPRARGSRIWNCRPSTVEVSLSASLSAAIFGRRGTHLPGNGVAGHCNRRSGIRSRASAFCSNRGDFRCRSMGARNPGEVFRNGPSAHRNGSSASRNCASACRNGTSGLRKGIPVPSNATSVRLNDALPSIRRWIPRLSRPLL